MGCWMARKQRGHPVFQSSLEVPADDSPVVVDGNCITSRGAGTALAFSLMLVEILYGEGRRHEIEVSLAMHSS